MAEKKIEVVVRHGLKIGKKYPAIGTKIKVDQVEAERLLALGAVELPTVEIKSKKDEANQGDPDSELIARIEAVASLEELDALDIENPSEAVLSAAKKRAEELQQ